MTKKILFYIFLIFILFDYSYAFAEIIEDDVVLPSLKGQVLSKPNCGKISIKDEALKDLKNEKFVKPAFKQELIEENLYLKEQEIVKNIPSYKLIDENAEVVKVSIHSVNLITTKDGLKIGQKVEFKVAKDVYKNDKIFIKKDTPIDAFIELISKAGRFGEPDEIEIGRFFTKDVKNNPVELVGTVRKQGADRGIWVRPLYNTGYGAIFYFVKGGRTKIKPEHNFELYYE